MQPAKVLIVDDHAPFRQEVRNSIEREEDCEVIGVARGGRPVRAEMHKVAIPRRCVLLARSYLER
jgi:DNA-binding NarL/FixJ family response regulator